MTIKSNINQSQIGNPLDVPGDRVQLPFGTIRLYWHNGNPQAEKVGAKHFGGWFAGADDFQMDVAACGLPHNGNFAGPENWLSREGAEYPAFSARHVLAAPIATRLIWTENKSFMSILVHLAFVDSKKEIHPYAPAVLMAKSYASKYVQDAFKRWVSDTSAIRNDVAPGVPVSMFYVPVGTFGPERNQIKVGKVQQSPIVPCDYYGPKEKWTEALLEKHFVGDEIGEKIIELKALAAEWLADKPKDNEALRPNASENEINAALSGSAEDEFPF